MKPKPGIFEVILLLRMVGLASCGSILFPRTLDIGEADDPELCYPESSRGVRLLKISLTVPDCHLEPDTPYYIESVLHPEMFLTLRNAGEAHLEDSG